MKQNVKTTILDAIFRLYYPICLRMEKLHALHEWRDGVRQCKKMYKENQLSACISLLRCQAHGLGTNDLRGQQKTKACHAKAAHNG